MIRKLTIAAALLVAVMATSVGTTVAAVHYAPELLPQGPRGAQGPAGPEGRQGRAGYDGQDGKNGKNGSDGLDGSSSSSSSSDDEDLAPNGMHQAEYDAYCDDLYEKWQEGDPVTGESDKEAIQEYGDALCDQ